MDFWLAVLYIPYATSSREKTGDIIAFVQFEEGGLLSETHIDTKSGKKSDDDSTIPPLISEGVSYALSISSSIDHDLVGIIIG